MNCEDLKKYEIFLLQLFRKKLIDSQTFIDIYKTINLDLTPLELEITPEMIAKKRAYESIADSYFDGMIKALEMMGTDYKREIEQKIQEAESMKHMKEMNTACTIAPERVVQAFNEFKSLYNLFRKTNGLDKGISNVHEILTGMTDKHGRICRYIKHQERKDPKDNWQSEIASALTGYIVYALMLIGHYGVDIKEGMGNEFKEAIKQHGKK